MSHNNNISQEQFEEIERFLQRNMSPGEEEEFTQRLQQDPSLQEYTNEMQLILLGIEETVLQEKLNHFHREIPSVKRLDTRRWLSAAAVIICVFAAAWWLFLSSSREEKLFTEYFRPDPGLISSMGSSDNYVFEHAMVDYKTGEYNKALAAWKNLLQANVSNDTLNYFIGSAYIALKETDSAQVYFSKVTHNSPFSDDARWYLGLALLHENKTTEAIPYIERSSRKEKETLLSKLKK